MWGVLALMVATYAIFLAAMRRARDAIYPQVQDPLLRVNLRPDLVLNGYRLRAVIEGR